MTTPTPNDAPAPTMPPPAPVGTQPKSWIYLLWGSGILLSGIVIGSAGTVALHHRPPGPPGMSPGMGPGRGPGGGPDKDPEMCVEKGPRMRPGGPKSGPEGDRPRGPGGPNQGDFSAAGPASRLSPSTQAELLADRLRDELDLSDEQFQKTSEAYKLSITALDALKKDIEPKVTAEHEKLRKTLKEILTPTQFKQWDKRLQDARNRWSPPGNPPAPGTPGPPGSPGSHPGSHPGMGPGMGPGGPPPGPPGMAPPMGPGGPGFGPPPHSPGSGPGGPGFGPPPGGQGRPGGPAGPGSPRDRGGPPPRDPAREGTRYDNNTPPATQPQAKQLDL